jgi:hypothetical protein
MCLSKTVESVRGSLTGESSVPEALEMRRSVLATSALLLVGLLSTGATASERDTAPPATATDGGNALDRTPQGAYAVSAFGTPSANIGVGAASGVQTGTGTGRGSEFQGGMTIFGAPIDRLTLFGTGERRFDGTYAPSAGIIVRLFGSRVEGWALSIGGKYKADGFADVGGETELGFFGSYARNGWHADANAVVGAGFEEKESDGEARFRLGYEVAPAVRVGIDGQARYRLAGSRTLAGGRHWDAVGGPQVGATFGHVYGTITVGPSSVDVASGIGWTATASVGAVAW